MRINEKVISQSSSGGEGGILPSAEPPRCSDRFIETDCFISLLALMIFCQLTSFSLALTMEMI